MARKGGENGLKRGKKYAKRGKNGLTEVTTCVKWENGLKWQKSSKKWYNRQITARYNLV